MSSMKVYAFNLTYEVSEKQLVEKRAVKCVVDTFTCLQENRMVEPFLLGNVAEDDSEASSVPFMHHYLK